jgi:hypothetical protein
MYWATFWAIFSLAHLVTLAGWQAGRAVAGMSADLKV